MSDTLRLFLFLCICGGVTLLSRELPFLLFRRRAIPAFVLYLGKTLPMAIMVILVLYCIKSTAFTDAAAWLPQVASLALLSVLHIRKRNTTLSIFAGTVCYMLLLRLL